MESSILIPVLSLGTIAAVLAFALWSRARTLKRKEDDTAPKSRFASDAPDH